MSDANVRRPRRTLASPTEWIEGVGLHSGADVSLRILPGAAGAGRVFRDRTTGQEIPAVAANVADTSRCTLLSFGNATLQTVEHVLSALAGLEIDDAVIEYGGPEVPAVDGSSLPFAQKILAAGVCESGAGLLVDPLALRRACFVSAKDGTAIAAMPADFFRATVVIDYPDHAFIGTQAVTFDGAANDYQRDVAPARTFGFLEELEWLNAHGLAKGASKENAVVLEASGYLTPIRFDDELVRHKLLDLIGDLALVERPIHAHIVAIKPSHAANTQLAKHLVQVQAEYAASR